MTIGSLVATSDLDMNGSLDDFNSSDDSNLIANSNENSIRGENVENQYLFEGSSNQNELNFNTSGSNDYLVGSSDVLEPTNPIGSADVIESTNLLESDDSAAVVIYEESYYADNSSIQEIINDAVSGSTIQFTGSSYKNLSLKINKPLNIISKSGTVITNTINLPVFTILEGGSGTNISGFVIKTEGSFVDASGVSKVNIRNNTISTKNDAIIFNNVFDSNIEGNRFLDFLTAIELKRSGGIKISKNNITAGKDSYAGIYLEDIPGTKTISIVENNMVGYSIYSYKIAIYVGKDVSNVLIKKNSITNWYKGIVFDYSPDNFTIYNNTISNNKEGVIVTGQAKNFIFKKNVLTENERGFFFDDDFYGTKGTFSVENNYFSYNGIDFKNKGADYVTVGRNFAYNSCPRVYLKYILKVSTKKSGNNYIFTVTDFRGNTVSDLPSFTATVTADGKRYTITFKDGMGYFNGEGSGSGNGFSPSSMSLDIGQDDRILSDWNGVFSEISLEEMQKLIDAYNGVNQDNSNANSSSSESNQDNNHELTNSSSSNSGSGSGDSGSSSGEYSINSDSTSSSSASSAGASSNSPSVSAGSSASAPSAPSESSSIKTLSVDDETFRVIGVGGLILLIILVIGMYYREDILEMIDEN